VLGAFLPDGTLVGFTFAFLGRLDGQLLLYSQIAAVDPAYQGLGLGATLKEAQRAWAREQGLPAVAWAFDPLQARNASFNLAKLGAVARRYEVNLYGPRSDELNAGLDTDRLLVVWPVDAKPPGPPPAQRGPDLVHSEPLASGLRRPVSVELPLAAPLVEIEIPADLALVRAHDPALARQWQTAVRTAFLAAFGAGYVATNVRRAETPTGQRVWYLLEQRPTPGREP
jgi:predicted GNAT superfamily acetyltransferase